MSVAPIWGRCVAYPAARAWWHSPKEAQMKEPRKKPSLRGQWASISLEQKLAMFVAPVVVFVVTTTLIPAVRDVVWDGFTTKPTVTVPPTTTTPTTTTLAEPLPHHRGAIPGHRLGIGSVVGARGRGCRTLR